MTTPLSLPSSQPPAPSSPNEIQTISQPAGNDATAPVPTKPSPPPQNQKDHDPTSQQIARTITRRLYISHFLSTWNSRSFEFGAVLFLASIFPRTLLPLSIYALVRSASAILCGPIIGRTIDRRRRLPVVRFSIGELLLDCCGATFRNPIRV